MSKQDAQDELHAREALLGLIRELAESGVVLGAEAVERLRTALRAELAGGESVVTWPEASGEDPDFGAGRGSGGVGAHLVRPHTSLTGNSWQHPPGRPFMAAPTPIARNPTSNSGRSNPIPAAFPSSQPWHQSQPVPLQHRAEPA